MVDSTYPELEKIFSALIIPMNQNQSICYQALCELVDRQIKDGVEGFYCCGSSGEGLLLTIAERKRILEQVIGQVERRVPVIAHVGTIRTSDAIELAVHAKAAGADAISMIPPYYYHFTMDEIMGYYEDIMRKVPGFPTIIYNIPQFTGVEFNKENAKRLLDNHGIMGIKHTSNNLYSLERMGQAYPDKVVFNGFDEQFLGALAMGARATIGTTVNLFASLFLSIRRHYMEGNMTAAQREQQLVNTIVEKMVRLGIFNAVKYGWTLRGINCGNCRAPFKALSEAGKEEIKELMRNTVQS